MENTIICGECDIITYKPYQICNFGDCETRASYNFETKKRTLYCASHKKNGMINVLLKACCEEGCKKRPVFNFEGEIKALYCASHKKDGMIDIKSKSCCEEGCKIRPAFNIEGQKTPLYCVSHKKFEMINIINKTCYEEDCKKQPLYNYENKITTLYCGTHKKEGMINIKSPICKYENCKIHPNFNIEGQKTPLYCVSHKKEGMINIKSPICKTTLCNTLVHKNNYKGYCLRCFIFTFPDKPVTRNYKTKERYVVDFILQKIPNFTWITDKKIQDGCSLRRPDLLLDLGYQVIIIEVDENQHQYYDCSCENKRIMELSQDVGHRPIIFIRFNPDDYIDNDNKITSCWGADGKGICCVKKTKKKEWEDRLNTLKEQIEYWTNQENKTDKTIEVIQLFFNN